VWGIKDANDLMCMDEVALWADAMPGFNAAFVFSAPEALKQLQALPAWESVRLLGLCETALTWSSDSGPLSPELLPGIHHRQGVAKVRVHGHRCLSARTFHLLVTVAESLHCTKRCGMYAALL
jgi:hypothetical protein